MTFTYRLINTGRCYTYKTYLGGGGGWGGGDKLQLQYREVQVQCNRGIPVYCAGVLTKKSTAWCSEIGSLTSRDACNSGASSDRRGPISLHHAVHMYDIVLHVRSFWYDTVLGYWSTTITVNLYFFN